MPDEFDQAQELEARQREDALRQQAERGGLRGKTLADSALTCAVCDDVIPQARRRALPGVQTCVDCQAELERAAR